MRALLLAFAFIAILVMAIPMCILMWFTDTPAALIWLMIVQYMITAVGLWYLVTRAESWLRTRRSVSAI